MSEAQAAADPNARLALLLHRCARADQAAFRELYALTSPQLLAVLLRMLRSRDLAEDVLQEVYLSVWRNAGEYDAAKGRVMTWLASIARYRALDQIRRAPPAGDPALLEDLPDELPEDGYGPAEGRRLEDCLEGLADGQRRSLALAYFDGLSQDEVAKTLRAPLGTVKSWVRRGLESLRRCMEGQPA
jgi:RNA polymerase sigma-70 factor (ECF subfamily)